MTTRHTISATDEAIVSLDVSSTSRSPTILTVLTNWPNTPSRMPFVEGWYGKGKMCPTLKDAFSIGCAVGGAVVREEREDAPVLLANPDEDAPDAAMRKPLSPQRA
ncbi:MAG TPA: hypothetical protein VGR38_07210 [Candidatus Polarisedimenticolia bacterium]|jgi:hypothetical protein|nr:hypothetical protein [Candidatus Polarisedimenticolia bacterium]